MALVQQTPTLFLSFEATQTLRDCHRVAPKDNGTLLRDAVAAARSYALWDYAGLATRDRKALEARLEELQRCDQIICFMAQYPSTSRSINGTCPI